MIDPQISVVMPSLNYSQFISEAARSIIESTKVVVQVVVQDGGSTDGTAKVLEDLGDARIEFMCEADGGQSDALNRAISRCRSNVVGWLNADEYYAPGLLDRVVDLFERLPDVDAIFGDVIFVDEAGLAIRRVSSCPATTRVMRNHGCFISSSCFFFRRRLAERHPFSIDLKEVMDWDWYLRLLDDGCRFHYDSNLLSYYRIHGAQVTNGDYGLGRVRRLLKRRLSVEQQRVRADRGIAQSRTTAALKCVVGDLEYAAKKWRDGGYRRDKAYESNVGLNTCWVDAPDHAPGELR